MIEQVTPTLSLNGSLDQFDAIELSEAGFGGSATGHPAGTKLDDGLADRGHVFLAALTRNEMTLQLQHTHTLFLQRIAEQLVQRRTPAAHAGCPIRAPRYSGPRTLLRETDKSVTFPQSSWRPSHHKSPGPIPRRASASRRAPRARETRL